MTYRPNNPNQPSQVWYSAEERQFALQQMEEQISAIRGWTQDIASRLSYNEQKQAAEHIRNINIAFSELVDKTIPRRNVMVNQGFYVVLPNGQKAVPPKAPPIDKPYTHVVVVQWEEESQQYKVHGSHAAWSWHSRLKLAEFEIDRVHQKMLKHSFRHIALMTIMETKIWTPIQGENPTIFKEAQ